MSYINWIPTNAGLPAERSAVVFVGPHGEQIDGVFFKNRFYADGTEQPVDCLPAFWRPQV